MVKQQTLMPTVMKGTTSSSERDGRTVDTGIEFSDSRAVLCQNAEPFLLISNSQISYAFCLKSSPWRNHCTYSETDVCHEIFLPMPHLFSLQPPLMTPQPHPQRALETPYEGGMLQQPLQSFHTTGSSRLPRAVLRHPKTPLFTHKPLQHSQAEASEQQPYPIFTCSVMSQWLTPQPWVKVTASSVLSMGRREQAQELNPYNSSFLLSQGLCAPMARISHGPEKPVATYIGLVHLNTSAEHS